MCIERLGGRYECMCFIGYKGIMCEGKKEIGFVVDFYLVKESLRMFF